MDDAAAAAAIRAAYARKATAATALADENARAVARESGYADGGEMGLSCGNPTAIASLSAGETVVDLGSGGGYDVRLAAAKVGPTGFAIGLDASTEMLARARKAAARAGLLPPRVAFAQADFEAALPLLDGSVDVVISNCVINLLSFEAKRALMVEIHRVLKPDGRLAISDILARAPMPPAIKQSVTARVGCVGGAITIEEQRTLLNEAGFKDITLLEHKADLNLYFQTQDQPCSSCCTDSVTTPDLPSDFDANALAASHYITAKKAVGQEGRGLRSDPYGDGPLSLYALAYPAPTSAPPSVTPQDIADAVRSGAPDIAVIDVRRADFKGNVVRGALNEPAQSLPAGLDGLVQRHRATTRVVFYCSSSKGRGPRSAAYYQDKLDELGVTTSRAYVLAGGINAWSQVYGGDATLTEQR